MPTSHYIYSTQNSNNSNTSHSTHNATMSAAGWIGWSIPYSDDDNYRETETKIIIQDKVKKGNEEGYECVECKYFSPMAELNTPEEANIKTNFKCYSCRKGLK